MKANFLILCLLGSISTALSQHSSHIYEKAKSYYFSHPDSTLLFARQLDSLGTIEDSSLLKAQANHLFGVIYQLRSESRKALPHFEKMLDESIIAQDSTLESIALLSKGLMLVNLGKLDSAMVFYIQGEKIASSIGATRYQLRAMAEIARVLSLKGDHEAALKKCRDYYQKVKESENPHDLVTALAYLSVEFMHFHNHDSSLYYINKTLKCQQQIQNIPGIAAAQLNKGSVFKEMNQPDSASHYFELAFNNYKMSGFIQGLGQVGINLGSLYLDKGQYAKTIDVVLEAIESSKTIGDIHALAEEHKLLALAYFRNGNPTQAFTTELQHVELNDSIINIEKDRTIAELQTKYETEKKEQQIALQQAEIAGHEVQNKLNLAIIIGLIFAVIALFVIILLSRSRSRKKQALMLQEAEIKLKETQIEAAISSQEKERTRFAQDLHDGFGQMISILNLNLKSLEKDGSDREQIFEQSTAVLDEMYQELKGICFNLMPQTLIKSGITAAIQEFASRVNQTGKLTVETDFFGLEERLTEVQEISLYRITQEWINNTLKYSDADRVNVQITKDENEITLLIEDNGTGFDLELMQSGKGNGWRNMNSRANLIKGELEVDTTPGMRGSTLIVNAPTYVKIPGNTERIVV